MAQSLLDTVQRHTDYNVDPTIEAFFNDDLDLIASLVSEHLDPEFIDAYINTEFGKGILVGLLMNHLNDHYAETLEENEETSAGQEQNGEEETE